MAKELLSKFRAEMKLSGSRKDRSSGRNTGEFQRKLGTRLRKPRPS